MPFVETSQIYFDCKPSRVKISTSCAVFGSAPPLIGRHGACEREAGTRSDHSSKSTGGGTN